MQRMKQRWKGKFWEKGRGVVWLFPAKSLLNSPSRSEDKALCSRLARLGNNKALSNFRPIEPAEGRLIIF